MPGVQRGYVFGLGNPLLDMLVEVGDDLHAKYGLKLDDAILAEKQHLDLYHEIEQKYVVDYGAGGATLNTIKMIQWILREPHRCVFVGCVAADEASETLRSDCDGLQLCTRFELTSSGASTGKCAVLIRGAHRSMVTHLGAAQELTLKFVEMEETWKLIENAKIYYIAGFVINSCFDGLMKIAKHAQLTGKLFCFNLSAPFLLTNYTEQVDTVLPYVDILFANKTEVEAYAQKHGIEDMSLHHIAQHLAALSAVSKTFNRIVVVTRDAHPVIVAESNESHVREYPVPTLEKERIIDTTGAGDAFAAGFIAEYVVNPSIPRAIEKAIRAARYIIQRHGCCLGPREEYSDFV